MCSKMERAHETHLGLKDRNPRSGMECPSLESLRDRHARLEALHSGAAIIAGIGDPGQGRLRGWCRSDQPVTPVSSGRMEALQKQLEGAPREDRVLDAVGVGASSIRDLELCQNR